MMVPRPEVVALSVDLPPEECLAGGARLAVHALPRLPGDARAHRRRPAPPRPLIAMNDRGMAEVRRRGDPAAGLHRPGDEGHRRAPDRVPADEPAHGDRRRRVRRHGGDRHARGRARGDRRRDRGRVRPARRVDRAARRATRSASTARSRSTTSTSSSTSTLPIEDYHTMGGFVFGAARPRRRSRATRSSDGGLALQGGRASTAPGSSGSRSSSCRCSRQERGEDDEPPSRRRRDRLGAA